VVRSNAEYAKAVDLAARGLNDCEIARATGIPRATIRDWRRAPLREDRLGELGSVCTTCGHPEHDFQALPRASYAHLLGMYLGDGSIDRMPRTWRLRVALDVAWPRIVDECARSMQAVFPGNSVMSYRSAAGSRCQVVSVYSRQLICLFPQHGPGPKHRRPIVLADWQGQLVRDHPRPFIRGLIQSDGCRVANRVRSSGRTYTYPRYNFTNASEDIRALFTSTCDLLGIEWRRMNARNISIARRESVSALDKFVGPKR
jgi:Homeodomain-like domain